MFKHILVPVDGSDTSKRAVEKAAAMASVLKSDVTVVCVIDSYAFNGIGTELAYGRSQYLSAATAEANLAMSEAKAMLQACDITAATAVVEGRAIYKTILETAQSCAADLIVMGSHGRKGLEKLVLGSVTAQVLSHTNLPVLVVRE